MRGGRKRQEELQRRLDNLEQEKASLEQGAGAAAGAVRTGKMKKKEGKHPKDEPLSETLGRTASSATGKKPRPWRMSSLSLPAVARVLLNRGIKSAGAARFSLSLAGAAALPWLMKGMEGGGANLRRPG